MTRRITQRLETLEDNYVSSYDVNDFISEWLMQSEYVTTDYVFDAIDNYDFSGAVRDVLDNEEYADQSDMDELRREVESLETLVDDLTDKFKELEALVEEATTHV